MLLPTSGYRSAEIDRRQQIVEDLLPPDISFEIVAPQGSPEFLDRSQHFGEAINAAATFLSALSPDRFDAVILAGALDPGLAGARAVSPVPVVGPGETSMFLAAILGRRLSIVTVDRYAVDATHAMLTALPRHPEIASIRSMDLPVREVMNDFEIAGDRLRAVCETAVREDGAEAVFLGAMILGMLPITPSLHEILGVHVINPLHTAVAAAVQLARFARGA